MNINVLYLLVYAHICVQTCMLTCMWICVHNFLEAPTCCPVAYPSFDCVAQTLPQVIRSHFLQHGAQ